MILFGETVEHTKLDHSAILYSLTADTFYSVSHYLKSLYVCAGNLAADDIFRWIDESPSSISEATPLRYVCSLSNKNLARAGCPSSAVGVGDVFAPIIHLSGKRYLQRPLLRRNTTEYMDLSRKILHGEPLVADKVVIFSEQKPFPKKDALIWRKFLKSL